MMMSSPLKSLATSCVGECMAFYPLGACHATPKPAPKPAQSPSHNPPSAQSVRKAKRKSSPLLKKKVGLKPKVLDFSAAGSPADRPGPPPAADDPQHGYFDPFPMIPLVPDAEQYMAEALFEFPSHPSWSFAAEPCGSFLSTPQNDI